MAHSINPLTQEYAKWLCGKTYAPAKNQSKSEGPPHRLVPLIWDLLLEVSWPLEGQIAKKCPKRHDGGMTESVPLAAPLPQGFLRGAPDTPSGDHIRQHFAYISWHNRLAFGRW